MKNWIKIGLILFVVALIGLWAIYTFVYNKPHANYEKAVAEFSISAPDLFEAYRTDSQTASTKFNGKLVEINGVLSAIEATSNQTIAIFVLDEGMFGSEGIRVSMLAAYTEHLKTIATGETVVIKGYITGYNDTDVIVEFGSIVKR